MLSLKEMSIQLINKSADGIKVCRFAGESLVTIVMPRDLLEVAHTLPGLPKRGVYYLLDEDHGVISRVYAGQTVKGFNRFIDHKAKKEWWNLAILHLDTDWQIDKEFLDMLEAIQIDYIRNHGEYIAENTVTPQVKIDPWKEERLNNLHENILFRMKVLGFDLDRHYGAPELKNKALHISRKSVNATGEFDPKTGQFTVHAGSEVLCGKAIIKNKVAEQVRHKLFGDSNQREILKKDIAFSSASTAATFVLGGSKNGWTEWVDADGKTLDAIYR